MVLRFSYWRAKTEPLEVLLVALMRGIAKKLSQLTDLLTVNWPFASVNALRKSAPNLGADHNI